MLEFEDRSVRSFALVDTATGETVRQVERSPRGGNHGRFVLLHSSETVRLGDLGLVLPEGTERMLSARVCGEGMATSGAAAP